MIQLTKQGLVFAGTMEGLKGLRTQFDKEHFLRLPQFVESGLFQHLQKQLEQAEFLEEIHQGTHRRIKTEWRMADNAISHLLDFLSNDPKLFEIVQQITGCGQIGCFEGRVYRMVPGLGHYDSWHDDLAHHRLVAMSINLSAAVYAGGILQLKDWRSDRIVQEVANVGFGDAILFRLAEHLKHRVTPVEGTSPKTAFAGWFRSEPDFYSLVRKKRQAILSSSGRTKASGRQDKTEIA